MVTIEKLTSADHSMFEALRDFLRDFYPKRPPLGFRRFQEVLEGGTCRLYVARWHGRIVGMATLVGFRKLPGDIWIIEDMFVSGSMRGKGIGKKLVERLLDDARKLGAECVDLATRSEDARRFYIEKCGFTDKRDEQPFFGLRYSMRR